MQTQRKIRKNYIQTLKKGKKYMETQQQQTKKNVHNSTKKNRKNNKPIH